MEKREFTLDGKSGAIYEDGEIYLNGERYGRLYENGDLYVDGIRRGKLYPDGEIYIDGTQRGKLYSDGQLYLDGEAKGRLYDSPQKTSRKKSDSTYRGSYSGGGFLASTGVFGFAGILLGIICVCASYKLWTGQFWRTFDRYMEIGWRAYLAKGLFMLIPACCLIQQIRKSVMEKLSWMDSFSHGMFLQTVSTFVCLTFAACLIDGIERYLDIVVGWGILIVILACLCMALFPAIVGSVIGTFIKKLYWKFKES